METKTPAEWLDELNTILKEQVEKIDEHKQNFIDHHQYETAGQLRDIQKKLLDFLTTL